jgi:hypothetical protein
LILSAWLHDIGYYQFDRDVDHSITSEKIASIFLKQENYSEDKLTRVLHCVRAHRCKDIMPETLEAKIIAFSDSAGHMTDNWYLDMMRDDLNNNIAFRSYAKLERDYRDLKFFPEIKEELSALYESWKIILKVFEKTIIARKQ